MKATPLAAFAVAIVAALCAFAPGAASAQGRDNVYVVSGVRVDETAATGAAANAEIEARKTGGAAVHSSAGDSVAGLP